MMINRVKSSEKPIYYISQKIKLFNIIIIIVPKLQ